MLGASSKPAAVQRPSARVSGEYGWTAFICKKNAIVRASARPISNVVTWVQPAVEPKVCKTVRRQLLANDLPIKRWQLGG